MTPIHIQFTRFSAFYSPLISTMSGGFLAADGLEATHSIAPPGKSAIDALVAGTAQVAQSALSQGLTSLEKGEKPAAVHFAQINEKDGFFLTAREPDPDFRWDKLRGRKVLVDHGGQPLAMFKYACHKMGLDFAVIDAVDAGNGAKMDAAFRAGEGDYIHQQGPAPQQLEHDGVARKPTHGDVRSITFCLYAENSLEYGSRTKQKRNQPGEVSISTASGVLKSETLWTNDRPGVSRQWIRSGAGGNSKPSSSWRAILILLHATFGVAI